VIDGQDAGLLRVDEFDTHIHIDQLFILPEFQNQGFGRVILDQAIEQAKSIGLPLRLWVLRVNPAREFYERLGFSIITSGASSRVCVAS
jgi:GNAT superfamily N-acetyltransferase